MPITSEQNGQAQRHVEIAAAVMLSIAGLASSYSSFEASRWSSLQSTQYNVSGGLRVDAARAHETADHLYTIDVAIFSGWANAFAAGDQHLEQFYRQRFRAEFKTAFDAWMASNPMTSPSAASTPFALSVYRLAKEHDSALLTQKSDAAFRAGQQAGERGDGYVRNAVLLAGVLFLLGIVQQFRTWGVQLALLTLALGLLSVAVLNLLSFPRL
jgi:hypothetical protein